MAAECSGQHGQHAVLSMVFGDTPIVTYLGGYVHGTLIASRRMLPRARGIIVQVGSALAYRAIPLQLAYCGTKHAVQGFTESLRSELMHATVKAIVGDKFIPGLLERYLA